MQIHCLEIVTTEVDAVCAAYVSTHDVQFGELRDACLAAGVKGVELVDVDELAMSAGHRDRRDANARTAT